MTLLDLFPPFVDLRTQGPASDKQVTAVHSGNIGDIIYSLPTAFALGITHYVLNICSDPGFGGRVMTRDAALKLAPLLLGQKSIERVSLIQSQIPLEFADPHRLGIDYVLDSFRTTSADPRFHLAYRHALPFGISVDGSKRWLKSDTLGEHDLPEGIQAPYIVVGLTARYRRRGNEYYASLLRDLPSNRVLFVGVEEDLAQKLDIPGAFFKPADFQHLTRVLMGSSLFIGNASFPYALAEALKIPRLVELSEAANVAPLDPSGCPLHLYTEAALRGMILSALKLESPDLVVLLDQVQSLTLRLSSIEHEKSVLESELLQLQARRTDELKHVARLTASRNSLADQLDILNGRLESKTFLVKSFIKQLTLSTRIGRYSYMALARISFLQSLWRKLGPI